MLEVDNQLVGIKHNLSFCATKLKQWSLPTFGNNTRKIDDITKEIQIIQTLPHTPGNFHRHRTLLQELETTWLREEMFWHQRSRVNWLNYGDCNSRFFHLNAIQRGLRNSISGLINSQGEWVYDHEGIQRLVQDHFKAIYKTNGARNFDDVISVLNPVVSETMNIQLQSCVSDSEIIKATKKLGGLKAPGEDGFPESFGEDGSGGGGQEDASVAGHGNVRPVVLITDDIVAEADVSSPKRSKKKMLPESEVSLLAGGKSPGVLNKLLQDSQLSVEQGVTAFPTLPFITSSVTASPLEEGGDHTDSVTGPSLRSVAASARFVVLSDSSHHSATNSAGPKGDSFVRSIIPVTIEATTVTTIATTVAIPADTSKDKSVSHPSVFSASSSSEKTDHNLSLFTGRSGSGFDAGSIHAEEVTDAGLEEIYVPEWTVTKGFEFNDGRSCANMINHFTHSAFFKTIRGIEHEQLFAEFNVSAARNLSLSSEVRMRAEYNILEKRKWRSLAEEKDSLLGAKDKEIEELRSQLLKAKEESVVVAQLRARVSSLEAIEGSLRGEVASVKGYNDLLEQERSVLRLQVTNLESTVAEKDRELSDLEISSSSLRSQNQGLVSQVHELETSSARLREQLDLYEGNMKRLEEFQDNLMRPLETRLAEIDADFTRCCMRFQESFHPHLLNVVAGRRWLLTHGMKLLMAKCLNSTEYMEALGNAFGRAIEKGMQEGLAAGIEHGQAGRCLTDLEAYIPSAEVDFNSAVCDLRGLDFPLLQELSNKKDASTWDVMDLLRLDNAVAEALGMTDLQPDVSQLMVPVHHKQDRVVIGSQALSVALDICRGRVAEKMERIRVEQSPLIDRLIVSLNHPLSAEALIEPYRLWIPAKPCIINRVIVHILVHTVTIEEKIDASTGGDPAFFRLENEARDVVL
ncbi:hypothetical protein Tco_0358950 [Tanacetum coccineum]